MDRCKVDVWTLALETPRPTLLSPDEQARAARFRFDRDRLRWANARSALRSILAEQLQHDPLGICFALGPHGKPAIEQLEFNLSHSGGFAMVAVSRDVPVGIDLEQIRESVEIAKLLGRLGEPNQNGSLEELFHRWTRREAKSKALGIPLMQAPQGDLRVVDLTAPHGFAASLALAACDPDIRYHAI